MTMPGGNGWGNPVIGGTVLRIPAIQSPNYVHNVSGWAIFKDGSAEFNSITIPTGSGGSTIFVQGTTPTANHVNDLWVDTANANQILTWNGSAWVANQLGTAAIASGAITASLIAANTITAAQLAAGIIYAGIVNGTTITGATIVADGTNGEVLAYTGTPALGNLLASISGAGGTDAQGNTFKQGIYLYGSNGSFAGLFNSGQAGIDLVPPGALAHLTSDATVFAKSLNAGAANEQTFVAISSGKESSRNDAAVQVFSDSADGTLAATVTFEFGGNIYATITTAAMTIFGIPLTITNQTIPAINLTPTTNSHVTNSPQLQAQLLNANTASEQLLAVLTSGKESSLDDAALQLFSKPANGATNGRAVFEFGGNVTFQTGDDGTILFGQSTPPQSSGNAVLYGTGNGNLQVVDGLDGQTYGTQRRTLKTNSDTPCAASPGTTIFSSTVGVRSYVVRGMMVVSISTAAQQFSINIAPPSGTGKPVCSIMRAGVLISMTDFNLNSLTAIGGAATLAVGSRYVVQFETIMNVTGAGTFNIIVAGTNANDLTVLQHSYVSIEVI